MPGSTAGATGNLVATVVAPCNNDAKIKLSLHNGLRSQLRHVNTALRSPQAALQRVQARPVVQGGGSAAGAPGQRSQNHIPAQHAQPYLCSCPKPNRGPPGGISATDSRSRCSSEAAGDCRRHLCSHPDHVKRLLAADRPDKCGDARASPHAPAATSTSSPAGRPWSGGLVTAVFGTTFSLGTHKHAKKVKPTKFAKVGSHLQPASRCKFPDRAAQSLQSGEEELFTHASSRGPAFFCQPPLGRWLSLA